MNKYHWCLFWRMEHQQWNNLPGSWGTPTSSSILHQEHAYAEFWGHRHFPVRKIVLELVTESLGSLPRRLGMRLIFPSGFPRVAMASEILSVWKWGWSWVRRNRSPWPRLKSKEDLKTEWSWVRNHLGEDVGPFAEKRRGNLSQRGVGVDLTPGTGSFSNLHRTSANTHPCSSHPISAASK